MRERMAANALLCAVALFGLGACGMVNAKPDFDRARELVARTTGEAAVYDPSAPAADTAVFAQSMADGLTLVEALRMALLNNRGLQARFMEIGIARADLEQAGLLENPALSLLFLFPSGGASPNVQLNLLQSIADLWRLPRRKAVGQAVLDGAIFTVSREAGELVSRTKEAYFDLVGARRMMVLAGEAREVAARLLSAVEQQIAAGVAAEADLSAAKSELAFADLEAQRAARAEIAARRGLAGFLSYEGDLKGIELLDDLPKGGESDVSAALVLDRARGERLDLKAAESHLRAAEAVLASRRKDLPGAFGAGLFFEKPEGGGGSLLGPSLTATAPFFDQNLAQVGKAEFEYARAQKTYEALLIDVAQDVRESSERAQASILSARFVEERLLPETERYAELQRKVFGSGDASILAVLEAQRRHVLAKRSGMDARLEVAKALAALERAAGVPWESLVGQNE